MLMVSEHYQEVMEGLGGGGAVAGAGPAEIPEELGVKKPEAQDIVGLKEVHFVETEQLFDAVELEHEAAVFEVAQVAGFDVGGRLHLAQGQSPFLSQAPQVVHVNHVV